MRGVPDICNFLNFLNFRVTTPSTAISSDKLKKNCPSLVWSSINSGHKTGLLWASLKSETPELFFPAVFTDTTSYY